MLKNRSLLYFTLSLIIHAALMFVYLPKIKEDENKKKTTADAEKVLKVYLNTKRQIVRSEDSPDHRLKEKSFLSDKTRSFDRESVAKTVAPFKEGSGGVQKPQTKKDLKLSDLGFKKDNNLYKSNVPDEKAGERGSTNDHIENVALGDHTYLNTVEYKYYGFYFRIRQKLEQFWGRSIQETAQKLMSEKRVIASDEEHVTALRIVLDPKGYITAIKVLGSSGVKELDDAAVKAFNEAGPFPHPPKGLINGGKVVIQWGFVVKT